MKKYYVRNNFKDIFGIYLLEKCYFDGEFDMPSVSNFDDISKIDYFALYTDKSEYFKTKETCVCFYQYDHQFDGVHGLYNSVVYQDSVRLAKFKERFKNVKYIVAPDYSLFGDFPNALQITNIYKSRVCFQWLKDNTNAIIIPNVRFSFPFTFKYAFDGIEKGSNIAIGVLGLIKDKKNKRMFIEGFKKAIDSIQPKFILAYGFINKNNFNELFGYAKEKGATIIIPHSKIDMYKKEDAIYGRW